MNRFVTRDLVTSVSAWHDLRVWLHVRCQVSITPSCASAHRYFESHTVARVVAFSSLAWIFGECSTIHSLPAFFLFFSLWSGYKLAHANSTLYAGINPQWLSGLRRLWPNVFWQVACELFSGWVPTLYLHRGIVNPFRLRWVKGVCVFRCNLPPALLAEWPGSFTSQCGNTG